VIGTLSNEQTNQTFQVTLQTEHSVLSRDLETAFTSVSWVYRIQELPPLFCWVITRQKGLTKEK